MNKISIITVNRNNAEGLERTILSVSKQTLPPHEFIVIDGDSTDNSVEIINKYEKTISFWISQKDTGIFNAMNKGIAKSTGDYCYFLNSADVLASPDTLSSIFAQVHYAAPFINGNQINDFGNGQTHRITCLNRPLTLMDFYFGTIKHQATFIRRDLFDIYGLYDENLKIVSDWKFFLLTIGIHNQQPVFIDTDIVVFEWNGMSTSPEHIEKHKEERTIVLNEYFSGSIQADYEHFKELIQYNHIFEAMKHNKVLKYIIKYIYKAFRILGISK